MDSRGRAQGNVDSINAAVVNDENEVLLWNVKRGGRLVDDVLCFANILVSLDCTDNMRREPLLNTMQCGNPNMRPTMLEVLVSLDTDNNKSNKQEVFDKTPTPFEAITQQYASVVASQRAAKRRIAPAPPPDWIDRNLTGHRVGRYDVDKETFDRIAVLFLGADHCGGLRRVSLTSCPR